MPFAVAIPTRHTDSCAATGFVHGGVLLALTEMAYAAFEVHCGYSKPDTTVAVQRESRVQWRAPLPWHEGATIEVVTTEAEARGFTQEMHVTSTVTGRPVADFVHRWVWLDTTTGQRVDIPDDVCQRMLAAG
ncbi:MAG: thioesterase family protein [Dehalococcoidia bacterium]|nr:thioesterase family protein [Dehalococcoidia bacterium]